MVLHQPKGDDRGSPGLGPMSAAGPHVTEGLVPSAMLGLMQAQVCGSASIGRAHNEAFERQVGVVFGKLRAA